MLEEGGRIQAVLDWEICTLGDPSVDLGLKPVYWTEPDDDDLALLGVGPTTLPGFLRRTEPLARHASASSRDLSEISYYRAFGFWELACILQGVYAR